jgi:hypothetical protein
VEGMYMPKMEGIDMVEE